MPSKEYYRKNKERLKELRTQNAKYLREYWKKYREEHRDEINRNHRKFYALHKEQELDRVKEFYRNPQKLEERKQYLRNYIKQHGKEQYQKNREKALASSKKYQQEHKEQYIQYKRNRKARLRGGGNNKISASEWGEICNRYGNKCLGCGKAKKLTQDHVIPLKLGGRHIIDNLQPLCISCNSSKGTKILDYRPDYIDG